VNKGFLLFEEDYPMAREGFSRKLTAIISADVEGYSRLMGEDEEATVRTLRSYRDIMSTIIQQHRGRVVDSPGDNLLAEFPSVVDAMRCTLDVQREIQSKNAALPETRRMLFRIGVNLGDVIVDGGRIYGDGVNIAARVESLAEGGGICISGIVFDQVENKLALEWEYLGEQAVKNIKKPIRVYRARMPAEEVLASVDGDLKIPDKPSIAVLPFVNISGDPEQEYFSDGLTEDLITDLSKISGLFVIARNSVFTYKGKAVRVDQVGRELGVRHVLEGSVRRAGDRVRITAQLVDAKTGGHLWAERYDRHLKDIFALQDEVTQKIGAALSVKLTGDERERLVQRETENLEAFDCYLRGLEYYSHFTREAHAKARLMFEKAIALDPGYALPYAKLGMLHFVEWSWGLSQNSRSLEQAFELGQRAISIDNSLPEAYYLLGTVYMWKKQHELAITIVERGIDLNPNDADLCLKLGEVLTYVEKRHGEAIKLAKKAMRLNPHLPMYYWWVLGLTYYSANRYEESIEAFKQACIRNPDFMPTHVLLAITYSETDRREKAESEVAEILKINPSYSLKLFKQTFPFKDQAVMERNVDALYRAGLR
jgi:adenylate cyclase